MYSGNSFQAYIQCTCVWAFGQFQVFAYFECFIFDEPSDNFLRFYIVCAGKKNKALSQKKAELERGEQYAGFMHKKSSNGSWKKKWCVLKGCIFSYSK